MKEPKPIELDGRTGEGGGQLVRIAVALAAVASQPIRITNVRGNREGARGGGLKSQHVSSIEWLAAATDAAVEGLSVGSRTLEFRPRLKPSQLRTRKVTIAADSAAASTMLIFQAIFPFLLFAGAGSSPDSESAHGAESSPADSPSSTVTVTAPEPIEVELTGGTNVSFSLSYEYLDQVLLPTLHDRFGIRVDRTLRDRGWSSGGAQRGTVLLRVHPLAPGQPLRLVGDQGRAYTSADLAVTAVDASLVVPADMQTPLVAALERDLDVLFPGAPLTVKVCEDSRRDARVYVLLVARSAGGSRWGRDVLTSVPKKAKSRTAVSESVSRKVAKELYEEVRRGGVVDEFLQDQLVVFQALAEGRSSFPRSEEGVEEEHADGDEEDWATKALARLAIGESEPRKDKKTYEPFGDGSTHTTTARWVATELLPKVAWYNKGGVCEGVGMRMEAST